MKAISELAGLGIELPLSKLRAEIIERSVILSTLPPSTPGLLGWVGKRPTGEQLARRAELEKEIAIIEGEISRQTVVAPLIEIGRKHEREGRQERAASKRHERSRKARQHCREQARSIWSTEGFEDTRIGEVARLCLDDLQAKNMYCPQSKETIKKWLKEDSSIGLIYIPPAAQHSGRPKN